MRLFALIFCVFVSPLSFAEVAKISGQDAQNVCSILRDMYELQTSTMSTFPLAQVVQFHALNAGEFEYALGNADENVTCVTAVAPDSAGSTVNDIIRVTYNPEVSTFAKDRTVSDWQIYKAYNIQGALADNVCAQLETFNIVEEQAQVPPGAQVLFTKITTTPNIFGLSSSVSSDKYMACGAIDGVKTVQLQSLDIW